MQVPIVKLINFILPAHISYIFLPFIIFFLNDVMCPLQNENLTTMLANLYELPPLKIFLYELLFRETDFLRYLHFLIPSTIQ